MQVELALHHVDKKESEIKEMIIAGAKYQPDYISVFPALVKYCKRIVKDNTKLSCPIDFPFGNLETDLRQQSIKNAIKNGAKKIDLMIPSLYLTCRKYEKIKQDMSANLEICKSHDIPMYCMLEYRVFNHQTLAKICEILKEIGIEHFYASTGWMIDNLTDNSIACMYLAKKAKVNTIINGDVWRADQVQAISANQSYGVRFKTLHSLELWHEHYQQT